MVNPHNEFVVRCSDKVFSDSWPQSIGNLFTDHMVLNYTNGLCHPLSVCLASVILLGEVGKEKA